MDIKPIERLTCANIGSGSLFTYGSMESEAEDGLRGMSSRGNFALLLSILLQKLDNSSEYLKLCVGNKLTLGWQLIICGVKSLKR